MCLFWRYFSGAGVGAMSQNENRFYDALERIFTGAHIEGDSGYVNLLKIKYTYYKLILETFREQVAADSRITGSFREEFFDKLYSFFEKYFSESGSVYFVKTAHWQRVYEQVYADDKDVALFWKTHMLYYVKSDILFQSIDVTIPVDTSGREHYFYFDVGALEAKQNNEKREIVFAYRKTENNKHYLDVSYSKNGHTTDMDEIMKQTQVPESIVEQAFRAFKKQSEVDFFINKNAKQFLDEQLDMFMHQILLHEENIFDQQRLDQLKSIKTFALKIIAFIAQFEDELVKIWNKPKFALNSHYVITVDKLSDAIVDALSRHPNLPQQVAEWQELGMVDASFDFSARDGRHTFLPIDTKYFKDMELDILNLFDNLDAALDGRLIHSENYQALHTLQRKYAGQVQCIYIDPPYNTDSSPIMYANNYKHSSWLTLMANRLEISKGMLSENGIHISAIDDIELRYLITLQDSIFGNENYITTITSKCNPQGRVADKVSKTTEYHILHAKNILNIDKIYVKKRDNKNPASLKRTGTNSRREERPNRYYPILIKDNKISMITDDEYQSIYNAETKEFNDVFVDELRVKYESMDYLFILPHGQYNEKLVWQRTFERVKAEKDSYIVDGNSIKTPSYDIEIPKTLWEDNLYSNPEYGSEYLKHILGHNGFETPKSYHTVKQFLTMFPDSGLYLDYFGGSGSTVEAIIRSNNEDKGCRKYILVEMGEHFHTVILPRIKKICYAKKWLDGKAQDNKGISQFFKYYAFEQYENSLRAMRYKKTTPPMIFDEQKPFEQYIFYADDRFADVARIVKDDADIDFTRLYPNIDLAETVSNIMGLPIVKITATGVVLQGQKEEIKTECAAMTVEEKGEFLQLLKPLLWWGD